MATAFALLFCSCLVLWCWQGSFNAKALLDLYNTDPAVKHLKPYTPIIYESEVRRKKDVV